MNALVVLLWVGAFATGVAGLITAIVAYRTRQDQREVQQVTEAQGKQAQELAQLRSVIEGQGSLLASQGEQIDDLIEKNQRYVTALIACRGNNRILIGALQRHAVPVPELRFDDSY